MRDTQALRLLLRAGVVFGGERRCPMLLRADGEGSLPLHLLLQRGAPLVCVEALLHADALTHADGEGRRPCDIATAYGSYESMEWRESVCLLLGPAPTTADLAALPFQQRRKVFLVNTKASGNEHEWDGASRMVVERDDLFLSCIASSARLGNDSDDSDEDYDSEDERHTEEPQHAAPPDIAQRGRRTIKVKFAGEEGDDYGGPSPRMLNTRGVRE